MVDNILNEHAIRRLKERYGITPNKKLLIHLKQCLLNRNRHRELLYHDIEKQNFIYKIKVKKHAVGIGGHLIVVTDKNRNFISTFLPKDWTLTEEKIKVKNQIINRILYERINNENKKCFNNDFN